MGFGGHNVRKKNCLKCQEHTLEYLVERICATLGYIYFTKMLKLMLLCGLFLAVVFVTVPGKRDQLGNFFQNRVIATVGKSRL